MGGSPSGLGDGDIDRVRNVLSATRVDDGQMQFAQKALDALERQGIVAKVGNGWELCERTAERAAARQKQERLEQRPFDLEHARAWLQRNWEQLSMDGAPAAADFEPFRRERRADLDRAMNLDGQDAESIRRGLTLLGGPENAVLLCDLDSDENLSGDELTISLDQHELEEAAAPSVFAGRRSLRRIEVQPRPTALASETQPPTEPKPQPEPQQAKGEADDRLKIERATEELLEMEDEHGWYKRKLPTLEAKAKELAAKADKLEAEVAALKAQRRRTTRAEKAALNVRQEADDAKLDVEDLQKEADEDNLKIEKARARISGMKAAAEARKGGKTEPEAQAAGQAAYDEALRAAGIEPGP